MYNYHTTDWDAIWVKVDIGAEANILPLHLFAKMFPHLLLPDGSPDPTQLKHAHTEFTWDKSNKVPSLGCTYLDIAMPGEKVITSQFFLSSHYDQIFLGYPSCDQLGAYILLFKNFKS